MNLFFHKRILVATDFSECSKVALDIGISASKCMKTEIHILHTIEKLHYDYIHLLSHAAQSNLKEKLEEEARLKLETMLPQDMLEAGTVVPIVRTGKPFVEIIKFAEEKDVNRVCF